VHSHIHGTNLEYVNHYLEIDSYVDAALASQSSKILIRAYYYAKLNSDNSARPRTWTQYLNNFLTPSKLIAPLSESTMRELKDVLCNRYGLAFVANDDKNGAAVAPADATTLAARIREMRSPTKREVLADNDAYMILHIEGERKKERFSGNPYGYRSWYLTQDSISINLRRPRLAAGTRLPRTVKRSAPIRLGSTNVFAGPSSTLSRLLDCHCD
jgi:hypothetical protein